MPDPPPVMRNACPCRPPPLVMAATLVVSDGMSETRPRLDLLDAALAKRDVDVVADLAAPLPAKMIGWLLGFPDEMWPQLRDWSERTIMLGGGPRYFNPDGLAAFTEFTTAAAELYAERQR